MFQNRALGREETLLRHAGDTSTNLVAHPGDWFQAAPSFSDEYWQVTSFHLTLAGPGLLKQFQGLGGPAGGILEFGLDLQDGFGTLRNLASLVLQSSQAAKEWNEGVHNGTLVDLKAGNYDNGRPRAGLRGDLRSAALGIVVWRSPEIPIRYGSRLKALTWEADLLRDAAGLPLPSAKLRLETAATVAGALVWTIAAELTTGVELAAGQFELPAPVACERYRWTIELQFRSSDVAAHRELAVLRTSAFFMVGVWILIDSPWWTVRSLSDLVLRSETDRELSAQGWNGDWDVCLLRLPVAADLAGRLHETIRGRIINPGPALKFLEIQALSDVWYEQL